MLLICQDLLQCQESTAQKPTENSELPGRTKERDFDVQVERERLKAQVAEERVIVLEKELSSAAAEAERLRRKVSELEKDMKNFAKAPPSSNPIEDELRKRIASLEEQLLSADGSLEASERALRDCERKLQEATENPSRGIADKWHNSENAMRIIKRLRDKHMLHIRSQSGNKSTVGVVVEGLEISAIVPGGPLDRDFDGVRIEPHDKLVAVDGRPCDPDTLFEDLVGEDVVGSPVRIRIKQFASGRQVEVNVIRGSVARIQAIGELFLMFTEVLAAIAAKKRVTSEDILRIEAQAKVVNEFSTSYLDSFRSHINDL